MKELIATSAVLALLFYGWDGNQDQHVRAVKYPGSVFAQAADTHFLGDEVCSGCHPEVAVKFASSPHAAYVKNPALPAGQKGCEACHGPGKKHVESGGGDEGFIKFAKLKPGEISDVCFRCHRETMRDSQWQKTEHAKSKVGCLSCHQIHAGTDAGSRPQAATSPAYVAVKRGNRLLRGSETETCAKCHRQQVNEFKQNYHHPIEEGRMVCSDCHSPHPTKSDGKKADLHKQMCVTCHADVAGPFVYEHDPVTGWSGDGCVECHKPHGSHNPGLLKSFSRGLCSQCHTDKSAAHYPGQTCFTSGCHSSPHGSNSSPYFLGPLNASPIGH